VLITLCNFIREVTVTNPNLPIILTVDFHSFLLSLCLMMSRNRPRYISSLSSDSCLVTFFSFSNFVSHNFPKQFMTAFFSLFPSLCLTMSRNRSRQISSTSLSHPDFFAFASCPKRSKSLTEQPDN